MFLTTIIMGIWTIISICTFIWSYQINKRPNHTKLNNILEKVLGYITWVSPLGIILMLFMMLKSSDK